MWIGVLLTLPCEIGYDLQLGQQISTIGPQSPGIRGLNSQSMGWVNTRMSKHGGKDDIHIMGGS